MGSWEHMANGPTAWQRSMAPEHLSISSRWIWYPFNKTDLNSRPYHSVWWMISKTTQGTLVSKFCLVAWAEYFGNNNHLSKETFITDVYFCFGTRRGKIPCHGADLIKHRSCRDLIGKSFIIVWYLDLTYPPPPLPPPPSAAHMSQWIGSALVQIMACRLFGVKPLSKPMLGYCQLDCQEQTSVKLNLEFLWFSFKKIHLKLSSARMAAILYRVVVVVVVGVVGGGGWVNVGCVPGIIPGNWVDVQFPISSSALCIGTGTIIATTKPINICIIRFTMIWCRSHAKKRN